MSNTNRISVNVDNLNHWRSYAPPPNYWEEYTINCRECGAQMTVTAEDQRFYYEVEKRPEYWRPGCQPCRDRRDGVRENRRILAEALRNAKRTSDPSVIRAAIAAGLPPKN